MKHILVAADGSEGAKRAIAVAARLAQETSAALTIVTVGGALSVSELRDIVRAEGDVGATLDLLSDQILSEATDIAHRHGAKDIRTDSAWGDAAEAIMEAATRINSDMVVLGRRGRGRLTGLLLGSVSQKVVTLALCPVLVVP